MGHVSCRVLRNVAVPGLWGSRWWEVIPPVIPWVHTARWLTNTLAMQYRSVALKCGGT